MIERYNTPEMKEVWSDQNKYKTLHSKIYKYIADCFLVFLKLWLVYIFN